MKYTSYNKLRLPPIVYLFAFTLIFLGVVGCTESEPECVDAGVSMSIEDRNRSIAREFFDVLYSTDNSRADSYLSADYSEHQISAGFSAAGLLSFAQERVKAHADHYLVVHRTIAQNDLVFLHIEERLTATDSVARGEMLRFTQDGEISEHWSAAQAAIVGTANNNGYFLGSEVNRVSTAGREHGVAIMENDAELFRTLNPDLIGATRTDRYIQHNQSVPNGPAGLEGFITYMASEAVEVDARIKHVIAEGDYVVAYNYFKTTPRVDGFGEVIVFDIVRLTNDGRVDEHWDVVEEIQGSDFDSVF